ncbi:hypothetical protein [Rubrivirga marina]|uniref:TonB-dependent receptor plug domain-containing protein n=1 Tax=Rubrivirga marina TaxID=1196024 RepID=A0A271IY56_9BACT|nr:hypothetical protein [Rubrivirga marina]PAP76132.1 hypothetical protein BSZ37_06565 [Rubrivirga marina]
MRPALALAVAALAAAASAQVPDSTAAPDPPGDVRALPADSLAPRVAADSARLGPEAEPVPPFALAPGRPVTPVPATTAALDVAALLADVPGAFVYRLGAPGSTAGAALDGLGPDLPALMLDGRPVVDLITGAPRYDLLPLAAIGPLRTEAAALGRPGVQASLRDLRLGVPVTELRYLGGQDAIQHASGTHAQTRRPPAFLRGGSDASRLTLTGHAASRSADSPFAGGDVAHTDAFGRLLLTQPLVAAEVGVMYTDRTEGARAGVVPSAGLPVEGIFSASTATVRGSGATRRTLRTEPWLRLRLPFARSAPTDVGASIALQRSVFVRADGTGDTLRVHGRRLAAFAEQPLRVGPNRLVLRLDVMAEPAPGPEAGVLTGAESRLGLHAAITDSLRLGQASVVLGAGFHQVEDARWPSASARVTAGPASAGVMLGGRAPSWLDAVGLSGSVIPATSTEAEQTLSADAALRLRRGDWRLDLRAFGSATLNGLHLVSLGDTLAAVTVAGEPIRQGGISMGGGWRERVRRGFYANVRGTARAVLSSGSDLHDRIDASLPRVWATGRLGVRAEDIGDGVVDVDLAVASTAWTAFRSVRVEPATGALVLPEPGGSLGFELPARALVGLEATATFSAQASLFVRYDHALGERAYGAVVTQGEPLPPHVLRFGVFWALLN